MTKVPQSPDAEKGLLSSMMMAPIRAIGEFLEAGGSEEYFHNYQNMVIFRALLKMWQAKTAIDLVLLTNALEDAGALAKVGGAAYVTEIFTFVPTASNSSYYASILRDKWIDRQALRVSAEIIEAVNGEGRDLQEAVQTNLMRIASMFESKAQTMEMADLVSACVDRAEENRDRQGKPRGLSSGIPELDEVTRGFKPGQMVVIAADTGFGKSALAMQIAKHNATNGVTVAVFSLEMDVHELTDRLVANHGQISMAKMEWGRLKPDEVDRFIAAGDELSRATLIIRDEAFMSPLQFQAAARKLRAERKVQLIVVDYLQLMDAGGSDDARQVAVARCSRTIKLTAKELGIPIIALSQVTGDKARESRAIEQDSDFFMILEEDNTGDPRDMQIRIKKGRGCEKNKRIPVTFYGESVRFTERVQ